MKFTIGKEFRFEAAHSLPHLPEGHKCRNLHGHSYRVVVYVRGVWDAVNAWVQDYADISAAVDPVIDALDHRNLNDLIPGPTTAETLASFLVEKIEPRLPSLCKIEVFETPNSVVVLEL